MTTQRISPGEHPHSSKPSSTKTSVRWITNEADFHALEPYWDALLERSATRTPFMTWDWVSLWWATHCQGSKLCIAVVNDPHTGKPVAIAPLMIGRPKSGLRRALRHITFLGGLGEDASQGMDFLVSAGEEAIYTPLLCEVFRHFRLKWDVIDLPSVHAESPNLPWFQATLASFASSGERSEAQKSYMIQLPDTWEEQLAAWKSKERGAFRSKWRRLMEEHDGVAMEGGKEVPMLQAFDELWRLHAARFAGRHSMFLNDAMRKMHRELVQRWESRGRIVLPLISADGKMVAARYGFLFENKFWSYQAGYDPEYGRLTVGHLSLGWTAQCVMARGIRVFDHMPGDARYKVEWSTHTRQVVHLEAFNPLSITATAFRLLRAVNRRRHPTTAAELGDCACP